MCRGQLTGGLRPDDSHKVQVSSSSPCGGTMQTSSHKLPKVVYISVGSFPLTGTVLKGVVLLRGDYDSHMRVYESTHTLVG